MIDPSLIISCSAVTACSVAHSIIMSVLSFAVLMGGFAYTTWLERRLVSRFQNRLGPNRVGKFGLLQPLADGLKLITKEDVTPDQADKAIFWIAPLLKSIPALIVLAVVPLGPDLLIPWFDGMWYQVPMGIADINVGVLWLLAITSIGTYGVVLAGWASGNKYSMLGGMRSTAQMISYELSMGLGMSVPIMIVGSMSIKHIIDGQAYPAFGLGWFVFQNPLAAGLLMVALLAEVNRAPFDMPEAESELVGGYHTEYSGMKFALFFAAEYIGMIAVSMVAASMFFGGYHWPLPADWAPILGPVNMILKIVLFLSGMVWIRATVPRIRYDRLMSFGWKVLFPLSMLAVGWTAVALVLSDAADTNAYTIISGIVFGLAVIGFLVQMWRRNTGVAVAPDMTDSRNGLGWAILHTVGALIAAPFALYDWANRNRGSFDGLLDETRRQQEEAKAAAAAAAAAASAEQSE